MTNIEVNLEAAVVEWQEDLQYYMDNYLDRPKAEQAKDNLLFLEKQLYERGFTFHQVQEIDARARWRILNKQ